MTEAPYFLSGCEICLVAGSFAVKLIVQLSPTVTQGRAVLGLDGNNNQQLVSKTESGGLPLLLLLLLLSGKIRFTLLSLHSPLVL